MLYLEHTVPHRLVGTVRRSLAKENFERERRSRLIEIALQRADERYGLYFSWWNGIVSGAPSAAVDTDTAREQLHDVGGFWQQVGRAAVARN